MEREMQVERHQEDADAPGDEVLVFRREWHGFERKVRRSRLAG